jgi:Response regulator containing CheY-like receiver domain and AraC-type DNA-binding domain
MAESLKAILVEDNLPMRTLLRSLVHALGVHDVYEAANGDRALEIFMDRGADLILTDLSMQPMDGIALTKAIRNAQTSPNPYVPIIMVTGHTERHRVEAARDAGVTEFLAKPITMQNLLLRITEVVERPRAFIRCDGYFGPDRRRRNGGDHVGPWRRKDDIVPNETEEP